MQGNELGRKKKVSTKETSKISKKSSPRASDTDKGSYKHNAPDLWDRGSMYACMVITYSKSMDQPGKVANPAHHGQLNRENEYFPVTPFAPDDLVSRDEFGRPVPRQSTHSPY